MQKWINDKLFPVLNNPCMITADLDKCSAAYRTDQNPDTVMELPAGTELG